MGAILADLDAQQSASLLQFAQAYGLAFQIQDDILDVTSTAAVMGKAVHKDAIEQKNTFPGLLGLAGAKVALQQTCQQAAAALQQLKGLDPTLLNSFLSYFDEQENK